MIFLDQNFPQDQRQLLRSWRIRVRHFGYEIGRRGTRDEGIIPFLHDQPQSSWFTLDMGSYRPQLRHSNYCLVAMDVRDEEAAIFVRRLVRQQQFRTQRKRTGTVVRLSRVGIRYWRLGSEAEQSIEWSDQGAGRQRTPSSR